MNIFKNLNHHLFFVRILAKIILSIFPFSYGWWSRIGIFRHGAMDDISYAWKVVQKHSSIIGEKKEWKGLELGPGDGLLSAFIAPAVGAIELALVDSGDFAHKNVEKYKNQILQFSSANPDAVLPNYSKSSSLEEMLNLAGGSYYSNGLISLKKLKSNSLDLIYSQAVLEHIKIDIFADTLHECYRLLNENGVMSHVVDFKDHLGGSLNNMRIASYFWEKEWFAMKSGFYTNRIKLSEILSLCNEIGFKVKVLDIKRWDKLPLNKMKMATEFQDLPDSDLLIQEAHLIMEKIN